MVKNYFILAIRNLCKHKFFTIINVLGLATGMSISLLLIAMLSFLWTYDDFHANKDRIYRVITQVNDLQRTRNFASAPFALADPLQHEFTGVEKVARVSSRLSSRLIDGDKEIPVQGYFVDPSFFEIFSFPFANAKALQDNQNGILLTQRAAQKIFGDVDPTGKMVELKGIGLVEISGLLKDPPKNSHLQFEVIASYHLLELLEKAVPPNNLDGWEHRNSYVYLLLSKEASVEKIDESLNKINKRLFTKSENLSVTFELQALNDIAPGRELYDQIGPDWGYASLSIFIFLTLLILLPACFNYTNISISRSLHRSKEIGLRKTMGGQRHQIFSQFLSETVLITLIALSLSFVIFQSIRSEFLSIIVSSESLDLTPGIRTISCFIVFAIMVGFIAGIVPAFHFSKLNPVQALRAKAIGRGLAKFNLRKVLIVAQFALSLGFIMGVVVVSNQYRHAVNYDFGFNQQNILDVDLQGANPRLFKNEFSRFSFIRSISMSSGILGTSASGTVWVKNVLTDSLEVTQLFVDEEFISNMNLSLLAGESFKGDSLSRNQVIVNEEFLKFFKVPNPAAAIHQAFTLDGTTVGVAGVVKNFNYSDLRQPIGAFFFRYDPSQFNYGNVMISSTDMISTMTMLETTWKKIGQDKKLSAKFFDDEIKEAYSFYFAMVKICGFLGFLAISISCLGLLGMVVFTVENRRKEVGVRKVMGASALSIAMVLSKNFLALLVVASGIAIPLAYLFFEKVYLQTQQYYHQSVGIVDISISLLIMLLLGLSTIFSQTLKAAKANPVDTLRYE